MWRRGAESKDAQGASGPRTVTVAIDGSADYADIGSALAAVADGVEPVVVQVGPGRYAENLVVRGPVTLVKLFEQAVEQQAERLAGMDQPSAEQLTKLSRGDLDLPGSGGPEHSV